MMCCLPDIVLTGKWVEPFIGAIIGGLFVLAGAQYSDFCEQKRVKEEKGRELKSLLQGIYDELSVVWDQYMSTMGGFIEDHETGILRVYYPIEADYFAFYHANLSKIGHINNSDLRRLIVVTYSRAKGFVDSFRMNNRMLDEFDDYSNPASYKNNMFDQFVEEMSLYATGLKEGHFELKENIYNLLVQIKSELDK